MVYWPFRLQCNDLRMPTPLFSSFRQSAVALWQSIYDAQVADPDVFLLVGAVLGGVSIALFVVTLLLVPWLIIRIPADYFMLPGASRSALVGNHPLLQLLFKLLRNLLGLCLVLVGAVLLFLPGQGLLTILLGIVVSDFPGKHRFVTWLVKKPSVRRPMNWLRQRADKEPIVFEDTH
ncbi:hypothetical protein NBRC116494_27910 [Aurantivibrio plasticivorans]